MTTVQYHRPKTVEASGDKFWWLTVNDGQHNQLVIHLGSKAEADAFAITVLRAIAHPHCPLNVGGEE